MKLPAYISIIFDDYIRISGNVSNAQNKDLMIEQISSSEKGIRFKADQKDLFKNIDLLEILIDLNKKGFAFGEDYKQLFSPAAFMRELQKTGILKEDFTSICWEGPDKWKLKINGII